MYIRLSMQKHHAHQEMIEICMMTTTMNKMDGGERGACTNITHLDEMTMIHSSELALGNNARLAISREMEGVCTMRWFCSVAAIYQSLSTQYG